MAVIKDKRSPFWRYDFQTGGRRFFGSTKTRSKREAEAIERVEREKAKRHVAQVKAATTSLRLDDVAGRWWQEVGQYHVGARATEWQLGYLIQLFGGDKLMTDFTDDDVARLAARRRGDRRRDGQLIGPFAVNDTIEQLKKLFTHARKSWGVHFDHEPQWSNHWLKEPQERVRELVGDEGERLEAATREDYLPFFLFAKASGLRLNECLLRWSEVDWTPPHPRISKLGKGGRRVTVAITPVVREILWPLRGHHPEFVFTYIVQRTCDGRVEGERQPITYAGARRQWLRLRKRAGVETFRFHDYRHNLATKLLRVTGNLKLVQRALNHADLQTTVRYAHVLDHEVTAALERVQESPNRSPNFPAEENLKGKSA
jgi:integrase